ncbi:MAG: hypothetical protein RRB13_16185 [bacterium]|nr:hypothetical protein [bacterium]
MPTDLEPLGVVPYELGRAYSTWERQVLEASPVPPTIYLTFTHTAPLQSWMVIAHTAVNWQAKGDHLVLLG